jgi:hypothetical protein
MIPNASLAPLGCICQDSINKKGVKTTKFRMMHNQTFPRPSILSVNLRVQKDSLPSCMYSFIVCLLLHYIVSLCLQHPSTRIYICKYDIDSAYRCCCMANECLTINKNMLLKALCMTFGGALSISSGILSETIADNCNALIHDSYWDHMSLFDQLSDTIQDPDPLPDSFAFAPAQDIAVGIPMNDLRKVDMYIDDTIGIALDLGDNIKRVQNAAPLVIKLFC